MAYSYERDVRRGTSNRIEEALGWVSSIAACLCILTLQYLLLKVHSLRKFLDPEAIPKVSEIWFAVVAFWLCQMILDGIGTTVLRVLFDRISDPSLVARRITGCDVASGVPIVVRVLVDRVVVSWMLHNGLVILLDIIIPITRDQRRNPHRELTSILSRAFQLFKFVHSTVLGSSATATHIQFKTLFQNSNSQSTTQTVRLQRSQTDDPNEGQRTLAWNLVVDKEALDEMKETLGPPGGFGELGFSVGGDGIRFEAMGVGTSFVLDFEVVAKDDRRVVAARRKTK